MSNVSKNIWYITMQCIAVTLLDSSDSGFNGRVGLQILKPEVFNYCKELKYFIEKKDNFNNFLQRKTEHIEWRTWIKAYSSVLIPSDKNIFILYKISNCPQSCKSIRGVWSMWCSISCSKLLLILTGRN